MSQTNRWLLPVIWVALTAIAAAVCSVNLPTVHIQGEYIPQGNDSFYHARRILDTANNPSSFYEYDTKIHAPEGSLLNWPWGYDYALGRIVRAGMQIGLSNDPLAILVWIPVAAVGVSMALLLLIGRAAGLSTWLLILSGLCMALSPTTQLLHGVGQIDHHFAELIFVLASLAAGLSWLNQPASGGRAVLLAIVLGAAPAIHNGLFVLQIPLLLTSFSFWLQDRHLPRATVAAFSATLLIAMTAVLIPSLSFREGRFEFSTLSWFHFYVTACTALMAVLLSRLAFTRKNLAIIVFVAIGLMIPVLGQLNPAGTFLTGANEFLSQISEMKSPLVLARESGGATVARIYSLLIYIAPATFVLCLFEAWRERSSPRLIFWLTAVTGLTLLAMQIRLHYFGDFALYLPWLLELENFISRRPDLRRKVLLGASLAALLSYSMSLRYQLLVPTVPAGDDSFLAIRPLLLKLRDLCESTPGIVLADNNAGHYIRFYTDCSVISNNFLLTQQHFEKTAEVKHLFSLSASDLLKEPVNVKYVLVRALEVRQRDNGKLNYLFFYSGEPRLANDLLLRPASSVPPGYTLLDQVDLSAPFSGPYAKLYELDKGTPPVAN
jgi:hypothetical protein